MALWRGWVPSVIGVVPYVGLNFAVSPPPPPTPLFSLSPALLSLLSPPPFPPSFLPSVFLCHTWPWMEGAQAGCDLGGPGTSCMV